MRAFNRLLPAVLLSTGVTVAQVPLPDYFGSELRFTNARTLATGGATALDVGPGAAFANPALLASGRSMVEGSFGLVTNAEQRTRVVYDQFDNTLGELAVAENISAHGIPGPLTGSWRRGAIGVGVGVVPVRDFGYRHLREYRDEFYVKTGEDRVVQAGVFYQAGAGFAYRPLEWFSAGIRAAYGFGGRSYESWRVRGPETTYVHDEGRLGSTGFGVGLALEPVRRLMLGIDWASGIIVDAWSDAESAAFGYPWTGRAGVRYRAPGSLPSTFSAELDYTGWHFVDSTLSSVLAVRAGVEHIMLSFARLRYGFSVEPEPFDISVHRLGAGVGVGFDAGPIRIDLGALFSRVTLDAYGFSVPLSEADLKVHGNRSSIAVTLSRGI